MYTPCNTHTSTSWELHACHFCAGGGAQHVLIINDQQDENEMQSAALSKIAKALFCRMQSLMMTSFTLFV